MPDHRCHRGAHPEDPRLFAEVSLPGLQCAAADLCWLLSRGYAPKSALKLVGDRYDLESRQREAVSRCCCSDEQKNLRERKRCRDREVAGKVLWADALNVIATVECALSGGIILAGRDGCFRDLAGIHGTYRPVEETLPALQLIGQVQEEKGISSCRWLIDRPVSNSGRLREYMLRCGGENGWDWEVELTDNPDKELINASGIIISSDSVILDHCIAWYGFTRIVIEERIPQAWILRLFPAGRTPGNSGALPWL